MTLGALIDVLARHQPEDTAVETGEQQTSYKQLLDLTRAIREQITRNQAGPGPIVVADDPGAGACAAIAAAQALGRAYVPLSASHPATRIQQILAAVEPALIVQSERTATRMADVLPGRYPLLTISRQLDNLSWARSPEPVVNCASPIGSDIAYVMFTSGTTGRPKGVPVRTESLMAYLDVATKRFGVRPGDRASHFFDLTFDLSVHDIFVTLLGGGTLVVIPAEQRMLPARFLREKEISHWFSVPSAAELLHGVGALRPGIFPHLRQTLFCSEPLRWPVAEAWEAAAPNSRIVNLYGPTEATIAISYYVAPRRRSRSNDVYGIVPIGQAFEGQHGRIFNKPEAGEQPNRGDLWLSGSQVISGYLEAGDGHDAFAPGPEGAAWYRTGDAVERDGDGLLHFVGRIDHQLKVSGYRVEPAEIENAIHRAFPACRSVVVRCDRGKRRGLVAAITCVEGDGPAASAVREACASSLPSYMCSSVAINVVTASDLARCVAGPFAGPRGPEPWLISVNSTAIIGRAVLERFDGHAVNVHPGRLPDFAGLYAVQWAIRLGESATAATAHFMTKALDAGDVICAAPVPIRSHDTGLSAWLRCLRAQTGVLKWLLTEIAAGRELPRVTQDRSRRRCFKAADALGDQLPSHLHAIEAERWVRAGNYQPLSSPTYRPTLVIPSRRLTLWLDEVAVADRGAAMDLAPGEARALDGELIVGCAARSALLLKRARSVPSQTPGFPPSGREPSTI